MVNIETAKMSERGQIIVPKEIREEIGATINTIFAFSALDKNTIVMKKIDTGRLIQDFRNLRSKTKKISPEKIEAEIHASRNYR